MTRINKHGLPDHDGTDIHIYSNSGTYIGRLEFDGKGNSRLHYPPGQPPHRRYPLKKKYRAR